MCVYIYTIQLQIHKRARGVSNGCGHLLLLFFLFKSLGIRNMLLLRRANEMPYSCVVAPFSHHGKILLIAYTRLIIYTYLPANKKRKEHSCKAELD